MIGTNVFFSSAMAVPREWLVGIYCRLSKDDDIQGESASISNQRELLTSVCKAQGWTIVEVYQDDGFTGLNMDRPSLKKLLDDVKAKKINLVITKDLSRLGRDYLGVGKLIEQFFPANKTRYIAFNDGIDTAGDGNDILPFKNVLNEMYSKDIGKKVHASYIVAAERGSFTGTVAPFGYLKDPKQKGHLIIDPETAPYAKQMFMLALKGSGPNHIARWLETNKVPCPTWWNRQRGHRSNFTKWEQRDPENGRFVWDFSVIKDLLMNPVYMGAIASQKRYRVFKVGVIGEKKPDEWIIVENCHEAIVSKAEFVMIQEKIKYRTHPRNNGEFSLFSGLLKCGDCGKALTFHAAHDKQRKHLYGCKTYHAFGKHHCTQHRVEETQLKEKVLETIRACAREIVINPSDVQIKLEQTRTDQANHHKDSLLAMIAKDEDRLKILGKMMSQLYEDRISGIITDENFMMLREKTQAEQKELEERISEAKHEIEGTEEQEFRQAAWLGMVEQYSNLRHLDSETLNRLVKRIVVYETIDEDNIRHQRIEIFFNFQAVPSVGEMKMEEQRPGRLVGDERPVMNVDTGEVFASIAAASTHYHKTSSNSHIREVCDRRRKTALGFHWKYV